MRRRRRPSARARRLRGGVVVGPAVAGRTRPAPPRRLPERSCVACRTRGRSGSSSASSGRPRAPSPSIATGPGPRPRRLPVPGRILLGLAGRKRATRARAQDGHAGRPRGLPGGRARRPGRHQHDSHRAGRRPATRPQPRRDDPRRSPWPGVGAAPAAVADPASPRAVAGSLRAGRRRRRRSGGARRDRAARHDHRQGARRAARRQPGGHHPRADQERHLRDHQPADRPRHRVARGRGARLRGGGGRRVRGRRQTDEEGSGAAGRGRQGGPARRRTRTTRTWSRVRRS